MMYVKLSLILYFTSIGYFNFLNQIHQIRQIHQIHQIRQIQQLYQIHQINQINRIHQIKHVMPKSPLQTHVIFLHTGKRQYINDPPPEARDAIQPRCPCVQVFEASKHDREKGQPSRSKAQP